MMIESTPMTTATDETTQANYFHSAQVSTHFNLAPRTESGVPGKELWHPCIREVKGRPAQAQKEQSDFLKNRTESEKMMEEGPRQPLSSCSHPLSPQLAIAYSAPDIRSHSPSGMQYEKQPVSKGASIMEQEDNSLPPEVIAHDNKTRHMPQVPSEFLPSIFSFLRSSEVSRLFSCQLNQLHSLIW
jgi:hypothetical protein